MMKSKLKNLDVAKQKGLGFVKKTLKNLLKEDFTEPTSFFYDSEFDYGGEDGSMPILFIGDIPSLWKKYVKQNKTSKTLAAGRCMFKEGMLSLEVKTGKGAKRPVLKEVYKNLLKPFANVQFVDSVESATMAVAEEVETSDREDDALENVNDQDLLAEAAEYKKEAEQKRDILNGIINNLEPKVKDISQIVVTDELIKEALNAMVVVHDLRTDEFLVALKQWLDATQSNSREVLAATKELEDLHKVLTEVDAKMDALAANLEALEKVQNPMESEVPPVETKASEMLKNALARLASDKQDFFQKAVDMFSTFKKASAE